MMYNKDDVIYILENNTTIRKGKIARKQGENYIIQLIGSCGALTMPEDQLFESEEAAEKSRQQIKLNSADVQNDFISVKPDPFDNWTIGIGFRVVEDIRNRQQDIEKALSEEQYLPKVLFCFFLSLY